MMKNIKLSQQQGELTKLEAKVMNWLMTEGYYAEYNYSDVEVKDIANSINININSTKGVISSLIKKQYLWISEKENGIPPLVYATNKGYKLSDNYESQWKEDAEMWG